MVNVTCPHCGRAGVVATVTGRPLRCPGCRGRFAPLDGLPVADMAAREPAPVVEPPPPRFGRTRKAAKVVGVAAALALVAWSAVVLLTWLAVAVRPEPTRTCPQCAESVRAEAKVCRFCGYKFIPDPAPRPRR